MPGFQDYYARLAQVESGNNPNARARTSSASGLYQFTRATWEGLGYAWSQVFDPAIQNLAIERLTTANARQLRNAGIETTNANLYATHFLGAGTAVKVLSSDAGDLISDIVSPAVIRANSFLRGMTVADFQNWLGRKMGNGRSFLEGLAAAPGPNPIRGFLGAGRAASEAVSGPMQWVREFFSVDTAARVISVVVGIALVIIAITVLMNSDKG